MTADAVKADALALAPALLLAAASRTRARAALVLAAAALLAARLGTTHAVSRIGSPPWLALAEFAHLVGAALWIGGIPYFLLALARADDETRAVVGRRFSRVSMAGVALVLCGGLAMSGVYIGSLEAFYGLAYGIMVGAKGALVLGLLALGACNFFAVRRLERAAFRTPRRRACGCAASPRRRSASASRRYWRRRPCPRCRPPWTSRRAA